MIQKRKKFILWGFLFVVACVCGYVAAELLIAKRPFYYAGTLETTNVMVAARVASDVADVLVEEGDVVASGQPLVQLTCDVYKINARQIDNEFNRIKQLQERGHASEMEYDKITRAKQDNDLRLNWCLVKSPIDGMVVTKFREVGEVVAPGTLLMSVANPYDIWAYFYVPYDVLYKLAVGQRVVGILPEANNAEFPGRIIKINEKPEFTPKNVQTRDERTRLVYGVKVQFDNPQLILKSGMTIESTLLQNE